MAMARHAKIKLNTNSPAKTVINAKAKNSLEIADFILKLTAKKWSRGLTKA